ncbi:G-protein coupled receptor 54 [Nematostella vectensis]|uniref:G-protein coupled receptor 54 n=1 Tax=Nematostella vectensis TaxID=45351 RepID=UPI0020772B4B|nr:G-protein coupled receptor 54 [Nematostella vectensis]XP_032223559.2 G-protein coupled receptor 54 [Nematostella vectensis]XP_032223560.2 G-protein coupled receptor 54 [Nematostella vectensis]XP_032223561.2 G-protein coupled receptor 54 [Nematostella vectensis]XP_048578590.1 G-protein coupled receptor 54 [Nematostella vectensis]XP_048578591.1 G-protein coupled receptor 54 [Nematostella vectensis]
MSRMTFDGNSSYLGNLSTFRNLPDNECLEPSCVHSLSARIAIIMSLGVLFLAILGGNVLLCYVIISKGRHGRNTTIVSILHLSVIDVIFTICSMPFMVVQLYIQDSWVFGKAMCKMVSFTQSACVIASMLNLSIISIERFSAVFFPFWTIYRRKIIRIGLIATWVIAIGFSSYYLTVKDTMKFAGKTYCFENWSSEKERKVFVLIQSALFYFLPLFLMATLHSMMIIKLRWNNFPQAKGPSSEAQSNERYHSPLRMHLRKKARNTLLLIVALFALCWTPYQALMLWFETSAHVRITPLTQRLFTASIWLMYLNCACHPLVYGFMSARYKKALAEVTRSVISKWSVWYSRKDSDRVRIDRP